MRAKGIFLKGVFVLGLLLSLPAKAQFPMAAHLVINGDYDGARSYYLKVLEKDSLNFNANQELGLLLVQYYDDKGEALFYINRAMRAVKQKQLLSELYLAYAQALHYDSQYKTAIGYYEKVLPLLVGKPNGELLKKQININIENCQYGLKNPMAKNNLKYRAKNIGPSINTAYPEFMPVLDPENTTLLYTARRNIILGDKKDGPEDKSHGEMFISTNTTGKFESGLPFYKPNYPVKFLESTQDLDAVIALSGNGEHILLYRSDQLFIADIENGKWIAAQRLPATINIDLKYEGSACISNDGKTIYYVSNKAGGYGGKDLYRSTKTENGDWSEGENLGEEINSGEDEDAPFLNYNETALYFSSKGLPGYGGYDVHKAKVSKKGISKPVNLGLPLNSPADDVYLTLNKNESEGYMSSSRKGGSGDWDIYHVLCFDRPTPDCTPLANSKNTDDTYMGFAFRDSVFIKDLVAFNAAASRAKGATLLNYFWYVNDTLFATDTSVFYKKFSPEGNYKITLQTAAYNETVDTRRDFCVTKELHVFNPKIVDVFFEPLVKANEDKLILKGTIEVGKLKIDTSKKDLLGIKLEPVFFNTNKFDLRKDAQDAIKRNIAKMKVDAAIVVKLTALTDPRATKEYNLKLSQKRANSVVAALEKNGIKRKRIIAVLALGEEEANIQGCNGDAVCLEKVYQQNRRVEFKIMGAEYIEPKPKVSATKSVKNVKPKK